MCCKCLPGISVRDGALRCNRPCTVGVRRLVAQERGFRAFYSSHSIVPHVEKRFGVEEEFVCFGDRSDRRFGVINFVAFAAACVKIISELLGLLAERQFGSFEC